MIPEILKENFPFASKYFEEKISEYIKDKTTGFQQSIILEGADTWGLLFFALEIARILNCKNSKTDECTCTDCSWIKSFTHPAITLVSPINFKDMDKGSASVISTTQCVAVAKKLEETSDFHRVFIFLDAKAEPLSELQNLRLENYSNLNYQLPEDWAPYPLTHKIFQDRASNVILKSVEEPPQNTTFIFLTNNRENIISTIISRSQIFKLPAKRDFSESKIVENMFKNYPNITFEESIKISEELQNYIKENSLNTKDVLIMLSNYFSKILKNNSNNEHAVSVVKRDIISINKAEKMFNSTMSAKVVLDWLLTEFANR